MQKYAYTNECRRGFVLKYFGDPAARQRCAGCDNCLGVTQRLTEKTDPRSRRSNTRKTARVKQNDDEVVLDAGEQRLLATLKTVRAKIAREEHVPAYIVFSDRTLAELALRRPRSLSALQSVRGVGPVKIERYGEEFLAAISTADETEAA